MACRILGAKPLFWINVDLALKNTGTDFNEILIEI